MGQRRESLGLSKRDAARRSGFSEGTWRKYEAGGIQHYGQWVVPSPSNGKLHAIAKALDLDPQEVFERAGRSFENFATAPSREARLDRTAQMLQEVLEMAREALAEVERLRQES